jgi:hypothetical protein
MEVSGQLHAQAGFTPGKKKTGTHCIGGCVGPKVSLDEVGKKKNPFIAPAGKRNPVVQPVA